MLPRIGLLGVGRMGGPILTALEAAGFEDVSVEFTHEVADGMHGGIVKAVFAAAVMRVIWLGIHRSDRRASIETR